MSDRPVFDADVLWSLPRLAGLTVSPDGSRVVTSVSRVDKGHRGLGGRCRT